MSKDEQPEQLPMRGMYRIIRGVIRFLVKIFIRLRIEGWHNLPAHGPYLLVANHLHWLDSPLVMVILPYRAQVFAGEKWEKHWIVGPLLRSVNAIFVNRGEVDRKALREALSVLRQGGVLGMAPEGTRSKTGGLQHGRSGAAYLAYHAQVKLVPVTISGQEKFVPTLLRLRRTPVRIAIGAPFDPPPKDASRVTMVQLDAYTEEMMIRLAAMLPPEYRGVYGDLVETRPDLAAAYGRRAQ